MKPGEINKLAILQTLQTMFGPELVETEYRFHPVRKWRFDYAVPEIRLAVEYNGHAGFVKVGGISRHGSIIGMTRDAEKLNSAIAHGWRVLQFTALHFRQQDRHKHNLRDVRSSIMDALSAMQEEKEKPIDENEIDDFITACVPGGDSCDPQQVADSIREYFQTNAPAMARPEPPANTDQ